ncbi:MAG: hypothetical protein ABI554_14260 [Flavobacterium sp.]
MCTFVQLIPTIEFIAGYQLGKSEGYYNARNGANQRAVEMIKNDEIPNYYMVLETVDYLINKNTGELQNALQKNESDEKH